MNPRALASCLLVAVVLEAAVPRRARAEDDVERARAAFLEGTNLVQKAQWGEALAAFERARTLRSHPVTTFNMAACERAMGRHTRARALFAEALEEHAVAQPGKQLPSSLVAEARAMFGEIDRALVHLRLTVEPAGAALAVDGRPLLARGEELVVGARPPGPAESLPEGSFVVVLDPGPHVLMLVRRGFRDVTVARTFDSGHVETLHLELSRLPARLSVSSAQGDAVVIVDGADVGPTPVSVTRAPGTYRVVVRKRGFVPYDAQVTLEPGQEATLRATLAPEKPSLLSGWWFWAAAAVVVRGAATTTYLLTRPEPTRPEVGGGSLGWRVDVN